MENTIMTEKIARRGVKTPNSYEPDILEKITVDQVIDENGLVLSESNTIEEVREWLSAEPDYSSNYFIVSTDQGEYKGIVSSSNLFSNHHDAESKVGGLIKRKNFSVVIDNSLRTAVEMMAKENTDVLPVVAKENNNNIIGILSYKDIIASYKHKMEEHEKKNPPISLKRQSLKILVHGKKIVTTWKNKKAISQEEK